MVSVLRLHLPLTRSVSLQKWTDDAREVSVPIATCDITIGSFDNMDSKRIGEPLSISTLSGRFSTTRGRGCCRRFAPLQVVGSILQLEILGRPGTEYVDPLSNDESADIR